jgi:hypothetical protein
MKKMMWWFSILAFLFLGNVAKAETNLLDLDAYKEGDIPAYAKHIIVKKDETTSEKWLTGDGNEKREIGQLNFPVDLSGDFDVTMRLNPGALNVYLIAEDEVNKIHLDFCSPCVWLQVNDKKKITTNNARSAWGYGVATVRLSVVNNVAKIYVNDVFSKKDNLTPDLKYTKLTVFMDTRDDFYGLNLGGSGNISNDIETSHPTSPADIPSNISLAEEFKKGKQEGVQQCVDNPGSCGITVSDSSISCPTTNSGDGIQLPTIAPNLNLHIPTIEYQSLGGKMNLWVDLQFTTTDDGKMWWILDDYGVNP